MAHHKTEWWLTFTGQVAQTAPDYSNGEFLCFTCSSKAALGERARGLKTNARRDLSGDELRLLVEEGAEHAVELKNQMDEQKAEKQRQNETIVNVEYIEDGKVSSGTVDALIGAAIFGPIGLIAGLGDKNTCKQMKVRVTFMSGKTKEIVFIKKEVSKSSGQYKRARQQAEKEYSKWQAAWARSKEEQQQHQLKQANAIQEAMQQTAQQTVSQPLEQSVSDADELRKFKALLDDGIITQEEFDQKKKSILGL